jgi:hypothetical protein
MFHLLDDFKDYAMQAVRLKRLASPSDATRSLADELLAHIARFQPSPELAARMGTKTASSVTPARTH